MLEEKQEKFKSNLLKKPINILSIITERLFNLSKNIKNELVSNFYKLQNLKLTNINLGKYHLNAGRIKDALFRFNIIKYIWQDDIEIAKYLGICYLLINNNNKAKYYLNNFKNNQQDEEINYYYNLAFSPEKIGFIPEIAKNRRSQTRSSEYLLQLKQEDYNPITETIKSIIEKYIAVKLPYVALEVYPENGQIGKAIKDYFPAIDIYAISSSEKAITKCKNITREEKKVYSQIYQEEYEKFFQGHNVEFNLIISLFSLNNSREIDNLDYLHKSLTREGSVVLAFPMSDKNILDTDQEYFLFDKEFIKKRLEDSGFLIVAVIEKELSCEKVIYFICNKIY